MASIRPVQVTSGSSRTSRIGTAMLVLAVLAAACSSAAVEHIGPAPTEAAVPTTVTDTGTGEPRAKQLATEARSIVADSGAFPVAQSAMLEIRLPDSVPIGGGRVWVPWPDYPNSAISGGLPIEGPKSELLADMERGFRHVVDQRNRWETEMPPYTPEAGVAFADSERVARRRAGTTDAWELVIDPSGLDHETRVSADQSAAYDHVTLCPAHPTAQSLGIDLGDTPEDRDRAGAVIEAFILGMRSPGGRPMHSWGTTSNDVAKLLVYSPGEPMEIAAGGHSLADRGFFPGDWSAQARQWLTRRAAQGAVTDSLVGHAVVSTGPQSLWEACSDLATIIPGIATASHRTEQLESLWARGLRLEFTLPPAERAWVADLSAAGHALAILCHSAGRSYLVDASTGQRLDAGVTAPARVEAMWLTWSRLSYRVLRNALFDGDCDGEAFGHALKWLSDAKHAHAAAVDWSEPHAWGSGVRNEWIAVREWFDVPQSEAWTAHRDHSWHLEFWCRIGIPVGRLVNGELHRPDLQPRCASHEWAALSQAAAQAPVVTSELSATRWLRGASWYQRMYLSPFRSLEEILGCSPDDDVIDEALQRPVERRVKKPWPPGALEASGDAQIYPRPMPPCPVAGWPPQTDQYWWPQSAPLAPEAS